MSDDNPNVLVGFVAGARTRQELEAMGPYDPMMGPYMCPGYWGPATCGRPNTSTGR